MIQIYGSGSLKPKNPFYDPNKNQHILMEHSMARGVLVEMTDCSFGGNNIAFLRSYRNLKCSGLLYINHTPFQSHCLAY